MKILTLTLLVVSIINGTALTMLDSPSENFGTYMVKEVESVYVLHVAQKLFNSSTDTINFKFEKKDVQIPTKWSFYFCDPDMCYPPTVIEKEYRLAPNDTMEFTADFVPATDNNGNYILGTGIGLFVYTNLDSPSEKFERTCGVELGAGKSPKFEIYTDKSNADLSGTTNSTVSFTVKSLVGESSELTLSRDVYEVSPLETKVTSGAEDFLSNSNSGIFTLNGEESKIFTVTAIAGSGFTRNSLLFKLSDSNNASHGVVYTFSDLGGTAISKGVIGNKALLRASVLSIGGIHSISLPYNGKTSVSVVSLSGREIVNIYSGYYIIGNYIKFSTENLGAGVYLIKIVQNELVQSIPVSVR